MPRTLRSRASRPNYTAMFQSNGDESEAGPSASGGDKSSLSPLEDEDSGSDFAPEAAHQDGQNDDGDDEDVEEADELMTDVPASSGGDESDFADIVGTTSVSKRKRRAPSKPSKKPPIPALAASRASRQSQVPLGTPNVNHRHRPTPIYTKEGPVERLAKPPVLFGRDETVPTKGWGTPAVSRRVGKAWGYNVGPGPLWELLEDRGWFPEARQGSESGEEAQRRPKVHDGVPAGPYEVLSPSEAATYLPTASDSSNGDTSPEISCYFGLYDHQTRVQSKLFDAHNMSEFVPNSRAHVFDAGAPAWGIDWCSIYSEDREHHSFKQYLAVGPLTSRDHTPLIGAKAKRPAKACIQIWSLRPSSADKGKARASSEDDCGEMNCDMVLCIDSGPAYELKWCPLPSNSASQGVGHGKLGILAGTFADGSLSLYAVPDPTQITDGNSSGTNPRAPVFLKMSEPLLRIEVEGTCCWALDWASSEVIAVGCTNGAIAVYNIGNALRPNGDANIDLLPTHYISVHQSAIRTLAWIRAPGVSASGEQVADNPTVIVSGGYDGVESLTDLRNMAGYTLNRTRDVINTVTYSTYCGGPVTIDHENIVKLYSLAPPMLGRGHVLLEPGGPVWSVHASDYHPQVAIGVTDGTCLTTNSLRSTRRGGSVPFLVHKIYQLEFNRKTGEYRMLEHFLPQDTQERATTSKTAGPIGTGAWPPEVSVIRVVWNDHNGLGYAPLLVSSTGSGLCRVDWLMGSWMRDYVPYGSIQAIRGEVAGVVDEDESD